MRPRRWASKDGHDEAQALVAKRGRPEIVRCDNGPELTANALRDWSALVTTSYIEPGAPCQNPFAESFNARVRDELLNLEEFSCLTEAESSPRTGASTTTASTHTPPWAIPLPGRVRDLVERPGDDAARTACPTTVSAAATHRLSQAVNQQPGSGHLHARTQEVRDWLQAHPRWSFACTATHASWLSQIEIFFSIIWRRLLKHGIFTSDDNLAQQIAYIETYNQTANLD